MREPRGVLAESCYTPAVPRKPPKPAPVIVKRTSHEKKERKRLTPELEAFARSDETRLRIRRPAVDRGKIDDPRESYAIPGVANRDGRAVYSSRAHELVGLWNSGELDAEARKIVGERLLDIKRLTLWRAMRVTGFAAFVEQVVGVKLAEAEALVAEAAERLSEATTPLNEREVALWLRTEAGLYEGDPNARAVLRGASGKLVLSLSIPVTLASLGLAGAGVRHAPLARAQREEEGRPLEHIEREPPMPAGARLLRRKPQGDVSSVREDEHEEAIDEVEEPSEPVEEVRVSPLRGPTKETVRERPVARGRAEGERPRFQDRARVEGERPRFQARTEGERPPARGRTEGERPRFQARGEIERPRFQARTEGDRPRFQDRARPEGERPRFQDRARPEGERPRFQDRARPEGRFEKAGERPAFQKRGAAGKAGDRPPFQKRGAAGKAGDRPAFQKRGAGGQGGDRPAFGKKPPFKAGGAQGKGFGKGKAFVKGKGFGERKPFGGGGDKKPFKKKPSDDEG